MITDVDISVAIAIDLTMVGCCSCALLRFGRISALHPATCYLFFHIYAVSIRLLNLAWGAQTLSVAGTSIGLDEIVTAALCSDLALIAVTVVWVALGQSQPAARSQRWTALHLEHPALPSKSTAWTVAIPCFLIGLFALIRYGVQGTGESVVYLYDLEGVQAWALSSMLLLHYVYGFKPALLFATGAVAYISAFNSARYPIVTACLFLCFLHLSRTRKKWPPLWMVGVLAGCFAVWFCLKIVSDSLRRGDDLSTLSQNVTHYISTSATEQSGGGDTQFLDMTACYITLVNQSGHYAFGKNWWPVLVVFIPRQLWPEKPKMSQYQWDISTDERPVHRLGLTAGLTGDGYINLGYLGVILIPCSIAYIYGRWYFRAMTAPPTSLARFAFISLIPYFVQVCRDGVRSSILFPITAGTPFLFAMLLESIQGWERNKKIRARRPRTCLDVPPDLHRAFERPLERSIDPSGVQSISASRGNIS